MRHFAPPLFFLLLTSALSAFTLMDGYYGDLLLLNDSNPLPIIRINYPGLYPDTQNTVIGAGYYHHSLNSADSTNTWNVPPHNTLRLSDLYGWGERNTSKGRVGFWMGDFVADRSSESNSDNEHNPHWYDDSYSRFLGSFALWHTPRYSRVKGLSLALNLGTADGQRQRQQTFDNTSTITSRYSRSDSETDYLTLTPTLLLQLPRDHILRFVLSVSGGRYEDFSTMVETASPLYPTAGSSSNSSRRESFRRTNLILSDIKPNGREIGLNAFLTSSDRNYAHEYSYSTLQTSSSAAYTSEAGFGLNFMHGKRIPIGRHTTYAGIQAEGRLSFYSDDKGDQSTNDIARALTKLSTQNYAFHTQVALPLVAEIRLFQTSLSVYSRINPRFYMEYFHKSQDEYGTTETNQSSWIGCNIQSLALGLKGRLGENINVSLIPSLENHLFMVGLDITYRIPRLQRIEPPED